MCESCLCDVFEILFSESSHGPVGVSRCLLMLGQTVDRSTVSMMSISILSLQVTFILYHMMIGNV